ncbi:MerR family transcriptional regulator [Streptococcus cameli]
MREKELRRTLSVFPIGSVMKLTDLTARQIRYYEEQGLISPERNEGNRRMYSLNDMDRLLEIKDYIADGYNIAAIKREYQAKALAKNKTLTDSQVRRILHDELTKVGGFNPNPTGFNSFRI